MPPASTPPAAAPARRSPLGPLAFVGALSRPVRLLLCAVVVVALLLVAALVPLPFTVLGPGEAENTLGTDSTSGQPVLTISGHPVRQTSGGLLLTTISATAPQDRVSATDVFKAWFRDKQAVVPHDSVYQAGQSVKQVTATNQQEMQQSQDSAVTAALSYLHLTSQQVHVGISLEGVGGPSAGLMFTLGIIDKLDGNGSGRAGAAGDLTNGAVVAGTGEITGDGTVGAVGGVALKTWAAANEHATVFLVPRDECSDAKANTPKGLRLVPVRTLQDAIASLKALQSGHEGDVPHC